MGIPQSVLIEQAKNILQEPLQQLGFTFQTTPPEFSAKEFWFEKQSQAVEGMFIIVEFQPSGFGPEEWFQMAINLYRRFTRDKFVTENKPKGMPDPIWAVRLSPSLWDNSGEGAMDYWWHFVSVEDLQEAYQDALEKIIHYGIPFLENPNSTWFTSLPNRLRKQYGKD